MDKLQSITSLAVPIMAVNIDTDIITPMTRLTRRSDQPLSYYAFEPLRYIGGDGDSGEPNPDFPLNQKQYRNARIMICGENFGCGSSRESAPAVLADLGFRCLIGSSFGDIFFNNCFAQGILPIVLAEDSVAILQNASQNSKELRVDLAQQHIVIADGRTFVFNINALRKKSLMEGLDDIELTLRHDDAISAWQKRDSQIRPWIYP